MSGDLFHLLVYKIWCIGTKEFMEWISFISRVQEVPSNFLVSSRHLQVMTFAMFMLSVLCKTYQVTVNEPVQKYVYWLWLPHMAQALWHKKLMKSLCAKQGTPRLMKPCTFITYFFLKKLNWISYIIFFWLYKVVPFVLLYYKLLVYDVHMFILNMMNIL